MCSEAFFDDSRSILEKYDFFEKIEIFFRFRRSPGAGGVHGFPRVSPGPPGLSMGPLGSSLGSHLGVARPRSRLPHVSRGGCSISPSWEAIPFLFRSRSA